MSENDCDRSPKAETKARDNKLDPDMLYEQIGGFGKFQLYVYVLICVPLMFIISCNFSYIFIASEMDYRCYIPECDIDHPNDTLRWINKAVPRVGEKLSKCERFVATSVNDSSDSACPWNFNRSEVVSCERFVYSTHEHMLLHEFNLTCKSNEWTLSLVGSLANMAECIALPFIGIIADKYGRRPILMWSIALLSIFGIAKTFTTNYITFMTLHFICALFGGGAFCLVFVFGSEVVGPKSRAFGAGIISNAASVGQIVLALFTMFIVDWRILLRLLYGLVAFTLTFIGLVPESVRWLLSVGKYEEGVKILKKVTKLNRTEIPLDTWNALTTHMKEDNTLSGSAEPRNDVGQYPLVKALKSKHLCLRLINCCYCYFTNSLIYFGLTVCSASLPGNKHMNFLYAAVVELPGNAAAHYILKIYGRKWSLIISLLVCSVACIASELLMDPTMKIILFLVGKFAIALSYTILTLYSVELFPTNVRQSMFNICNTVAGCGNIVAPLLPLSMEFMPSLPLILFGGTSFTSSLLILLLPETRNKGMPDTIDEAINI